MNRDPAGAGMGRILHLAFADQHRPESRPDQPPRSETHVLVRAVARDRQHRLPPAPERRLEGSAELLLGRKRPNLGKSLGLDEVRIDRDILLGHRQIDDLVAAPRHPPEHQPRDHGHDQPHQAEDDPELAP